MKRNRYLLIAFSMLALAFFLIPLLFGDTLEKSLVVTVKIPPLAQQLPQLKIGYIDVDTMIIYDEPPQAQSRGILQWEMVYGEPVDTIYRDDSVYIAGVKNYPNEVQWSQILYAKDSLGLDGWVISRVGKRIYLRLKNEEKKAGLDLFAPFFLYGETAGLAIVKVNNDVDLRFWGLLMVVIVVLEGFLAFRWWKLHTDKAKLTTFLVLACFTIAVFGYAKITDLLVIFGAGK